jgi:hypothetical protein
MKLRTLVVVGFAVALLEGMTACVPAAPPPTTTPPATGTLDQDYPYDPLNVVNSYDLCPGFRWAQTFTAGRTGLLDKVTLYAVVIPPIGSIGGGDPHARHRDRRWDGALEQHPRR